MTRKPTKHIVKVFNTIMYMYITVYDIISIISKELIYLFQTNDLFDRKTASTIQTGYWAYQRGYLKFLQPSELHNFVKIYGVCFQTKS